MFNVNASIGFVEVLLFHAIFGGLSGYMAPSK